MVRGNQSDVIQIYAPAPRRNDGRHAVSACLFCLPSVCPDLVKQPRRGAAGSRGARRAGGAGGPLSGLGTAELNFFNAARARFREVDFVSGTINDAPAGTQNGSGLGPRFNLNSCAGCHAQPAIGGTSPFTNPQLAVATLDGAQNAVPSFITLHGPVREARFIANPDGTPDGGVHNLFVISGRTDAKGCNIAQPNFAQAISQSNIIFRIPTTLFGGGQIENTPDINLENDAAAAASPRQAAGVSGEFNRSADEGTGALIPGAFNLSANDGTISRFGWKAQNKSLLMFAGEAYNVEQGVTNEIFPNERDDTASCQYNPLPEDATNLVDTGLSNSPASDLSSDIVNFAAFIRLSAGPTPAPATASTTRGQQAFANVGCTLCHIAHHTTARSIFTNQSDVTYSPYSDFEVHDMGTGLQKTRLLRGRPPATSSARRRCGALVSGFSSSTTAAPKICCRRSKPIPAAALRPTR